MNLISTVCIHYIIIIIIIIIYLTTIHCNNNFAGPSARTV